MDGGIFWLLELIRDHRGAVEYDLRARFGLGLRDIGVTVTPSEVSRLIAECVPDPASHVGAALRDWKHAVSHESLVLMDMFDLLMQVNSDPKRGRPKPYPRPWAPDVRTARPGVSQEAVRAALRAAGHLTIPI